MTVIWVAEDINKDGTFKQTKAEVLCTLSCLLFIKHYYPTFKTIFFVDQYTKQYYQPFGFLHLFDEVNDTLLDEEVADIDRKVFWAIGKIRAQKHIKGPTLTLDLDFRLFNDISKFGVFDGDVSALWVEQINRLSYFNPAEALEFTDLNWEYPWTDRALNVSFLYLKNEKFKNYYCETAMEYMRKSYGKFPIPNTKEERNKPILFAEQYMLYQLVKKEQQETYLLIDDYSPMIRNLELFKSCGVDLKNCGFHFYHYGSHKEDMVKRTKKYYSELSHCHQVTNLKIKDKEYLKIFNKIYNLDENEGSFC
jgi:hypothetical protein